MGDSAGSKVTQLDCFNGPRLAEPQAAQVGTMEQSITQQLMGTETSCLEIVLYVYNLM